MLTTISALGLPMARSVAAATFCGLTEKAVLAVRPVSARVRALTPVSLTGPRMMPVAVTPGVPVIPVQHPAEGGEPVLGRGVGLGVRETGMPGQRGDVDDPAVSPFEHAGQQEPGEQQRG
jgi:hypothetical protein